MQIGILQSIQVGTPKRYSEPETWETSFFREPSVQPRWLYTSHLDGDRKADRKNHGQLHNDFCHFRNKDVATAQALATCPLLHEFWQELVVRRVKGKN